MNKKYFAITTLIFSLLCSAACSTVVGAYSDDPYGPVVNCDSELPMDKLIQCVKDQYEIMDKIYEHPFIKDDKIFNNEIKNDKKASKIIRTNIKKVENFSSIKPCYKIDKCQIRFPENKIGLIKYDEYKDKAVRILASNRSFLGDVYIDKNRSKLKSPYTAGFSLKGEPSQFERSYKNKDNDIILFEREGKSYIYATKIEMNMLQNDKILLTANIQKFCSIQDISKKLKLIPIDIYLKSAFEACGIYRFSYVLDKTKKDLPVLISLDQRENPNKIYLKIAEDIFEIEIKQKDENN